MALGQTGLDEYWRVGTVRVRLALEGWDRQGWMSTGVLGQSGLDEFWRVGTMLGQSGVLEYWRVETDRVG